MGRILILVALGFALVGCGNGEADSVSDGASVAAPPGARWQNGAPCSAGVVADANGVHANCRILHSAEEARGCRGLVERLLARYPGLDCRASDADHDRPVRVQESTYREILSNLAKAGF